MDGRWSGLWVADRVEFSGTRQVITFTENMLVGVAVATGELLWSRPFHSARDVQAITPLVYGNTIIVTAFESGITAIRVNKRDGKWGTDNAWKNDEQYSRFSNAVIVGDAYFALSGKSGGLFMYLDARTGEVLWKGEPRTAENAAIVRAGNLLFALKDDGELIVAEFGGTRQVITFTENMLVGVSAATGELLWSRPFHSARDVQAITPLVYQDTIIVTAFESGITAIRIAKRDGKWGTDNAWKNDDQYSRFSNAVIVGDAYFALSGKSGGLFMYLDAKTGEVLWKGEPRTAENAAIARAGKLLFALKDDGELIVAEGSNPRSFTPLARYQVSDGATWAAPSISGNRLFVKGLSSLTLWTID